MKRLILGGALVGVVAAALIAWEARESVAYASDLPAQLQARPISEPVDERGLPNLGVYPVPKGRR